MFSCVKRQGSVLASLIQVLNADVQHNSPANNAAIAIAEAE